MTNEVEQIGEQAAGAFIDGFFEDPIMVFGAMLLGILVLWVFADPIGFLKSIWHSLLESLAEWNKEQFKEPEQPGKPQE